MGVFVQSIKNPLNFLLEPAELPKCVFADSLVTVSEGGRDLGKFIMTVEFARRAQQPCMLLHAQSQGAIDDSPCGTTVTGEGQAEQEDLSFGYRCLLYSFHFLCPSFTSHFSLPNC